MHDTTSRKFILSLELHREVARLLNEDPERVRSLGMAGAAKVRSAARSLSAHTRISRWENLLSARVWDGIRHYLTDTSEDAAEMRKVGVFLGVIDQQRRNEIVTEVLSRPDIRH